MKNVIISSDQLAAAWADGSTGPTKHDNNPLLPFGVSKVQASLRLSECNAIIKH